MSFDLRIRFVGLAVYVPQDGKAMHVLLPSTAGHVHGAEQPGSGTGDGYVHPEAETELEPATRDESAPPPAEAEAEEEEVVDAEAEADAEGQAGTREGHRHPHAEAPAATTKMDDHHARIVFDKAYLEPGQTQLKREYVMLDLQGRVLDLSGLATSARPLNDVLPDELAPMDRVAHAVPRDLVTDLPDARLAGRVTFDAGALTDHSLGALWTLNGGNPQRMTLDTEWTIRDIQSTKTTAGGVVACLPERVLPGAADPADLAEEEKPKLPELFPIADTIHLMVFHTVANQLPPAGDFDIGLPAPSDRPDHFMAYYSVCPKRGDVPPAGEKPLPAPARRVVVDGPQVPATGKEFPSLSCVQAWASLAS